MSTYLQFYHGSFWLQFKVPKSLVARYENVVRQNLQTECGHHRSLQYGSLLLACRSRSFAGNMGLAMCRSTPGEPSSVA